MKPVLVAALLAFSSTAFAADAERMDAARAYVETPTVQNMMDNMFSPQMLNTMMATMLPEAKATEEQRAKASQIVSEELNRVRKDVVEIMTTSVAETFSLEEIKALTAFYSSKEGQSIQSKMQPFMTQYLRQISPVLQQAQIGIAQRIKAEIGE